MIYMIKRNRLRNDVEKIRKFNSRRSGINVFLVTF